MVHVCADINIAGFTGAYRVQFTRKLILHVTCTGTVQLCNVDFFYFLVFSVVTTFTYTYMYARVHVAFTTGPGSIGVTFAYTCKYTCENVIVLPPGSRSKHTTLTVRFVCKRNRAPR